VGGGAGVASAGGAVGVGLSAGAVGGDAGVGLSAGTCGGAVGGACGGAVGGACGGASLGGASLGGPSGGAWATRRPIGLALRRVRAGRGGRRQTQDRNLLRRTHGPAPSCAACRPRGAKRPGKTAMSRL